MVLRVTGAEFEGEISFSGLNQVLLPVLGDVDGLGAAHRDALRVALGFGTGPPPDRLLDRQRRTGPAAAGSRACRSW
jgi:hypothetical protein